MRNAPSQQMTTLHVWCGPVIETRVELICDPESGHCLTQTVRMFVGQDKDIYRRRTQGYRLLQYDVLSRALSIALPLGYSILNDSFWCPIMPLIILQPRVEANAQHVRTTNAHAMHVKSQIRRLRQQYPSSNSLPKSSLFAKL